MKNHAVTNDIDEYFQMHLQETLCGMDEFNQTEQTLNK